jgi:hypothetical protein
MGTGTLSARVWVRSLLILSVALASSACKNRAAGLAEAVSVQGAVHDVMCSPPGDERGRALGKLVEAIHDRAEETGDQEVREMAGEVECGQAVGTPTQSHDAT